MTSSHITCISLRFLVARRPAADSGLPPLSIYQGSIHKVSQAPEAVGDYGCEDAIHPPPSTHPSLLIKSHSQLDVISGEVLVTLWVWVRPKYPEFTPPGLSLCWCAILQQCYLSVRAVIYLYICVCLGGWKEFR